MLFVLDSQRGQGLGSALVGEWEDDAVHAGYRSVMTSSLSNERAQHLYRRLGYSDCGSLLLPGEATEILFRKELTQLPEH